MAILSKSIVIRGTFLSSYLVYPTGPTIQMSIFTFPQYQPSLRRRRENLQMCITLLWLLVYLSIKPMSNISLSQFWKICIAVCGCWCTYLTLNLSTYGPYFFIAMHTWKSAVMCGYLTTDRVPLHRAYDHYYFGILS